MHPGKVSVPTAAIRVHTYFYIYYFDLYIYSIAYVSTFLEQLSNK